jgi:hypothetical protein
MADLTLTLGDITFADFEVPERINWGGEQLLTTHQLIGGQRVVDAMGPSEAAIDWSGWIIGQNAVTRAQTIDAMRVSGVAQQLTWNGFNYQVIVRSFTPSFERFYQIPYRISLEVIANNTQPITSSETPPIDQAVSTDNTAADALVLSVGDSVLSSLMGVVDTLIAVALGVSAISAALSGTSGASSASVASAAAVSTGSISTAPQSTINGITSAIQPVLARVTVLIEQVTNAIGTPTTFGGVTAGILPQSSANALTASVANTFELFTLMQLQAVLGRLATNLGQVGASASTVTTAGGNLFALAQNEYGDATDWAAIAAANGLVDPFIQGVDTLTIPAQPGDTGGILAA